MLHPAVLRKIKFFYAFGNTPPVLLTEYLTPEEPVAALLLGCGDPRSILYTVHANATSGGEIKRQYDFTCCDLEPAVLARNVLLFTLIADDESGKNNLRIWNAFYHLYLDKESLSLLQQQAQKLQLLSTSTESWHGSKYGNFLRICNSDTLTQLHQLWKLYAKTQTKESDARYRAGISTLKIRHKEYHSQPSNWSKLLGGAAGPLCAEAIDGLSMQGLQYWKHGTTAYNASEIKSATYTNPSFLYTGMGDDEVMVHYGSNPIQCFHIGAALATLKPDTFSGAVNTRVAGDKLSSIPATVVDTCRLQFNSWCVSFRKVVNSSNPSGQQQPISIRSFIGDALALCDALGRRGQNRGSSNGPSTYTREWSMTPLVLDGCDYQDGSVNPAPLMFNIIDTSNVADHVGLLHLLLVTNTLLVRRASTVLYTETFGGEDSVGMMEGQIGGDLGMMSLLFDIAPLPYNSFTCRPSYESQQRLAWKFPCPELDKVKCSTLLTTPHPVQLAECLLKIYLVLFQHEDLRGITQMWDAPGRSIAKYFRKSMSIHYTRETYAVLLNFIKGRVLTKWSEVMYHLTDLIEADRTLLTGSNFYQELRTHWHILSLESIPHVPLGLGIIKTERLPGWRVMPAVVCVVLTIPRKSLKVFDTVSRKQLGTPLLKVSVNVREASNSYCAIHATFGGLRDNGGKGENLTISVDEDASGWHGTSQMIIAWYVPAWTMLMDPDNTTVTLELLGTAGTTMTFMDILGPLLQIYQTKAFNGSGVYVTRNMPGLIQCEPPEKTGGNIQNPDASSPSLSWVRGCDKLDVITIRQSDSITKSIISSGKPIEQKQDSPGAISITSGEYKKTVVFPVPVAFGKSRLRIARKSQYIEVVVPIAGPQLENHPGSVTPVIIQDGKIIPWNLPRVNLTSLPALDITSPANRTWLTRHIKEILGYTDPLKLQPKSKSDTTFPLAPALSSLFTHCTGLVGTPPPKAIYLRDPSTFAHGIFILILDVRLDVCSHTILFDTYVVGGMDAFEVAFAALLDASQRETFLQLDCAEVEMRAWRDLLPGITERCRTWSHDSEKCVYIQTGGIPAAGEGPLCDCSRGKIPKKTLRLGGWGRRMPGVGVVLAEHGRRAAISPFFPGPWQTPGDIQN